MHIFRGLDVHSSQGCPCNMTIRIVFWVVDLNLHDTAVEASFFELLKRRRIRLRTYAHRQDDAG